MIRSRLFSAALVATVAVAGVACVTPMRPALAADEKSEKPSVRPEVGKPLQAAQEAIKNHDAKGALEKIQEADQVSNKTPYENYVISYLRFQASAMAGDMGTALRAGEAVLATGQVPSANVPALEENLAKIAYQSKDYPKAIEFANRYFKDGGNDQQVRVLVVQCYYLQNDFADAARTMRQLVQGEKAAGKPPTEDQLTMLMSAEYKQSQTSPGYADALFQLVQYYPKKDYWNDALLVVQKKQGFNSRYLLDVDHLKLAAGVMDSAPAYMDAAQTALEAGLPGDAKVTLQKGFAAKVLGQGPDAARQQKLMDRANQAVAEDQKSLAANEKIAASKPTGDDLFTLADAYTSYGQYDKAIAAYQQGIAKGASKYPLAEAKLHLGIAYILSNQKPKAKEVLKSIQSSDGAQDLALLWMDEAGINS